MNINLVVKAPRREWAWQVEDAAKTTIVCCRGISAAVFVLFFSHLRVYHRNVGYRYYTVNALYVHYDMLSVL